MRKEFCMSDEQLAKLLDACKPVICIGNAQVGCFGGNAQENANRAWGALGRELGFDYMSVRPVQGKDYKHFTADATESARRAGRGVIHYVVSHRAQGRNFKGKVHIANIQTASEHSPGDPICGAWSDLWLPGTERELEQYGMCKRCLGMQDRPTPPVEDAT